jgi:hypothetical protein
VLWAGETGDPHAAQPFHGLLAIQPADVVAALESLVDAGQLVSAPGAGVARAPE